ncbi:hypothetical protein DL769_007993 [Monosporascus sp. CRB-8-3]|nr:hypothetical protein DL769_007993 [Monosporascus sp. CRB-8-3]
MAPLNIAEPTNLALAVAGVGIILLVVGRVFYNLFLHPLRSYPGPLLWRISSLPFVYWLVRAKLAYKIKDLHDKYGSVVRIRPNELSFGSPEAWTDIYGHRKAGAAEFAKYGTFFKTVPDEAHNIIMSTREEHRGLRRALAHGFSERSLREQEPIIGTYVDLLIQRLRDNSAGGAQHVNMREWLNWTTFDVIGELGFGSAFGCLKNSDYHPWVRLITDNIRIGAWVLSMNYLGLQPLVRRIVKAGGMRSRDKQLAMVSAKLAQRMESEAERPDFIEGLIKQKDYLHLSFAELVRNAEVLIVAGSESTSTLLSGAIYLLTTHPDKLARVTEEVRTSFTSEEEITLNSVSRLSYMLACLNETLRYYPPVASALPRQAPKGGAYVDGKFVPEDTVVAVWQWAINHNPKYWTEPMSYAPERFLGDPRYKGDRVEAMQPFSTGPRKCLGQMLAYAQMRLILAKIVWNFDMVLEDDSKDWLKRQPVYILWDRPPLNVRLMPARK